MEILKMFKRLIGLVSVLVISFTIIACGEANADGSRKSSTAKIVCYSGGKEIVNVNGATDAYVGSSNPVMKYTYQGKDYVVMGTCVSESNSNKEK